MLTISGSVDFDLAVFRGLVVGPDRAGSILLEGEA